MLNLILQDPVVPLEGAEEISESISLLELTLNGGFMMIPIFLLWMVGIYVFVERMMNIKKASPHKKTFVAAYSNGYIYYAPTDEQLKNVGGAQEDSDTQVAPGWQKMFEDKAQEILKKL